MSDLPFVIGVKRAVPDARGNWTPLPAYEGWVPSEPGTLANHLRAVAFAMIAAGFLTLIERMA